MGRDEPASEGARAASASVFRYGARRRTTVKCEIDGGDELVLGRDNPGLLEQYRAVFLYRGAIPQSNAKDHAKDVFLIES